MGSGMVGLPKTTPLSALKAVFAQAEFMKADRVCQANLCGEFIRGMLLEAIEERHGHASTIHRMNLISRG
jgi:hypothetical protein